MDKKFIVHKDNLPDGMTFDDLIEKIKLKAASKEANKEKLQGIVNIDLDTFDINDYPEILQDIKDYANNK